MNLLCIDYGTRKSGLAYSIEGFAFALSTVETTELIETISRLIGEKKIQKIILGMPYHISGGISTHGRRVLAFREILEANIDLPIELHDERLTTSEARIFAEEKGGNPDIDAEAARLILASWIEESA